MCVRAKTEIKTKSKNQKTKKPSTDRNEHRQIVKQKETEAKKNCNKTISESYGEKVCHVCPGNFCCCNSNYKIREMCALAKFHQIIYLNAEQ